MATVVFEKAEAAAEALRAAADGAMRRVGWEWEDPDRADGFEDPHAPYPVPPDEEFEEQEAEFLPALDIERIGQRLIRSTPSMQWIQRYPVAYVWRRSGTTSGQMQVLGQCRKTSGELRYYSEAIYLISLAADFCRDEHLTNLQIEALTFHELSHAILLEDKKGNLKPSIVGHDLECFWAEYRRYGAWRLALRSAEIVFREEQSSLGDAFDLAAEKPQDNRTPTERLAGAMQRDPGGAGQWINS